MQFKPLPALALFLGSYFPLSLILLLQDYKKDVWSRPFCRSLSHFTSECSVPLPANPWKSLSFFAVCFLSLLLFFLVLRCIRGEHDLGVVEAKAIPNDLINYVFPYVVSFMGLDVGENGKFYGFLLFLAWMFVITYRSGQILMNPLLLAFGWRLYEIKANIGDHLRIMRALSRSSVVPGDSLRSCLVQDIYVLFKGEDRKNDD